MNLPKPYAWLDKEPAPRILLSGLALFGVKEKIGQENNPIIMGWAREIGGDVERSYHADSVPWCGLYLSVIAKRAGWSIPDAPLWALNWGKWGTEVERPMLGDVLTFKRPDGGHVGIYVGEDDTAFHVLGGNQGDAVSIVRIDRERMKKARRSPWRLSQPSNVRVVRLKPTGMVSKNEA